MNSKIYFTATDDNLYELWVSDGTASGTSMLKDISLGSSYPRHFQVLLDKIYFRADDYFNGKLLWASDGTAAGTTMVANAGVAGRGNGGFPLVVKTRHTSCSRAPRRDNKNRPSGCSTDAPRELVFGDDSLRHGRGESSSA